ncbi:MAG: ParB N-terminal domain-containing protein [Hellea sp.]|nr:ParB N-terminal domain-containing protein [Hellea sp.]
MMRVVLIPVDEIYVPASKKKEFDEEKVLPLAEEILENDDQKPIYVRKGKGRYVLQSGVHRLEAIKLLGSDKIKAYVVQAQKF